MYPDRSEDDVKSLKPAMDKSSFPYTIGCQHICNLCNLCTLLQM